MREALSQWFDEHGRDLPWREDGTDPWAILVCEVMSQQTPVARVITPWRQWLDLWPTPADLAAANPAEVLRVWGSLGYPRRALRLQECAAEIASRHGNAVPDTEEELLALPGVGPYTAAAVMAFGFGKRALVLDTNIRRVLARLGGTALPSPSLTKADIAKAATYLPEDRAESVAWNTAIMELGALVCTATNPACGQCPLTEHCQWRAGGYPADEHKARRKVQGWEGTMRQARGQIMAVLRSASTPVPVETALAATDDRGEKALASLLADGLAVRNESHVGLPGSLES